MLKYFKNAANRLAEVVMTIIFIGASFTALIIAGFLEVPVYILTGHSALTELGDRLLDYIDYE